MVVRVRKLPGAGVLQRWGCRHTGSAQHVRWVRAPHLRGSRGVQHQGSDVAGDADQEGDAVARLSQPPRQEQLHQDCQHLDDVRQEEVEGERVPLRLHPGMVALRRGRVRANAPEQLCGAALLSR